MFQTLDNFFRSWEFEERATQRILDNLLMRQAGLNVPGIYGPSKEEWANLGMEAPKM